MLNVSVGHQRPEVQHYRKDQSPKREVSVLELKESMDSLEYGNKVSMSRSVRELTQGNKMQKRRYEGRLRERVMSRKERRQEEGKRVFRKPERQDIRREVDDERNYVKRSTISKERRLRTDNVLTDSRNEEKIISTRRG